MSEVFDWIRNFAQQAEGWAPECKPLPSGEAVSHIEQILRTIHEHADTLQQKRAPLPASKESSLCLYQMAELVSTVGFALLG
jgi:hypothetical protein